MKKIILSSALISTVLLGSFQTVLAAQVKEADTPVGIEFEEETDLVPGPYKGVLTLVYKPSSLNFGKYKGTGAQITASAVNIGGQTNKKQWLVVNDDRDYTTPPQGSTDTNNKQGGQWNLTAKMSELTDGKTTNPTVLPATLKMNFKDIEQYTMGTTPDGSGDYIPNHPNDAGVIGTMPAGNNITLTNALSLESDGTPVEVMVKDADTNAKVGVATQLESANLIVQPTANFGGTMSSRITWTLSTGI